MKFKEKTKKCCVIDHADMSSEMTNLTLASASSEKRVKIHLMLQEGNNTQNE